MKLGFETMHIDERGYPTQDKTPWKASCFVLFFWVVFVGKVVPADD